METNWAHFQSDLEGKKHDAWKCLTWWKTCKELAFYSEIAVNKLHGGCGHIWPNASF